MNTVIVCSSRCRHCGKTINFIIRKANPTGCPKCPDCGFYTIQFLGTVVQVQNSVRALPGRPPGENSTIPQIIKDMVVI